MKDTFIGDISPFGPKVCPFSVYISRFKQFFMVNGVPESKRAAVFFTVMGDEHFQLLTNLVVPKDPTTMPFDECVSVLADHFQPARLEVVERQKFFNCKQSAEDSIKSFVAELKRLSLNSAFDTHFFGHAQ
ncbi:hypothetical protein T12_1549 [Trichinella patagoniensis]|uniref:Retrotransposon gag domain-containing protein n=1 Tax=Trichinella patagoniensis TaxID=990121 RepID=A0A0V0ZRV7_9BILA|nr:hypothetical protein T12_1549 [Trichinella patagoniensis]